MPKMWFDGRQDTVKTQGDNSEMMSLYTLGPVREEKDPATSQQLFTFKVVGVLGHPLVAFSYKTQEEAEYSRSVMLTLVESAKAIVADPIR
jgi:hypothetical protein